MQVDLSLSELDLLILLIGDCVDGFTDNDEEREDLERAQEKLMRAYYESISKEDE